MYSFLLFLGSIHAVMNLGNPVHIRPNVKTHFQPKPIYPNSVKKSKVLPLANQYMDHQVLDPVHPSNFYSGFKNEIKTAFLYPLKPQSQEFINFIQNTAKKYNIDDLAVAKDFEQAKMTAIRDLTKSSSAGLLPIHLKINDHSLILTSMLGRGGFGVTFDAIDAKNPSEKFVVKLSLDYVIKDKDSTVFDKEIWALEKVGRLVFADKNNQAIAFKKITGTSYHTALLSINEKRFQKFMKEQYDGLFLDFYKKYGFHHGDIRPQNCIIDENGDFQLIDFGNAYPASTDKEELISQLHKEYDHSQKEYKLDIAWAKYGSILNGKTDTRRPSQKTKLRKFIDELKKAGRNEEASNFEDLVSLETDEFLLDGSI